MVPLIRIGKLGVAVGESVSDDMRWIVMVTFRCFPLAKQVPRIRVVNSHESLRFFVEVQIDWIADRFCHTQAKDGFISDGRIGNRFNL